MDFLSPRQHRSLENTVSQIQSEHEKSQNLKRKIEDINNKLIISNLSKLKLIQKIGHINVKIFSDIVELFNLYRDEIKEDISRFLKYENCKFYMVEIFITNALQIKLKDMNWSLWLSIKSKTKRICKTIEIKQHTIPIIEILPIDLKTIECEVSASIILQSENSLTYLPLDKVSVDIAYHFEMSKKNKILSTERKVLEITKCHNPSLNILEIRKPPLIEYRFLTKVDSRTFINLFIQNCYHKMDLELFSELTNDTKNNFVLKFSTGLEKHSVSFNKESKILTLRSNILDMIRLKHYFWSEDTLEIRDGDKLRNNLKVR